MKPILMRHCEPRNESFKVWRNGDPYIHNPWHYHPEYEITYIHRGRGTLFIGDRMENYDQNDIILIGPNLPHELRSDIRKNPDLYSESISAHFQHHFIGESFYNLPEVTKLNELLDKTKRGVRVTDSFTQSYIKEKLIMLPETTGLKRIVKLLQILERISESPGLIPLSSTSFMQSIDADQDHRINLVYEYVMQNFKESISIAEVAELINMTNTSFCRFFKERTNKSFVNYLNEIRVGYACKLLLEGELSISQIAYHSGFGNVSYFNKQFKKIKGTTPTEYLEDFLEKNSA
ncbi:AraC family transcriptional regulator [Membranihabitans maritimus]|uniref:AraC family transcriptional regulator n=1 Tax=Membranihabitans maritimus TaxID=2904244 RepID=UPI001F457F0D|nr:AraC family transcriptional regulator [Membranihabitans maritimus]